MSIRRMQNLFLKHAVTMNEKMTAGEASKIWKRIYND